MDLLGSVASTAAVLYRLQEQGSCVPAIQQYVQWVDQFFGARGGEVYLRDESVSHRPRYGETGTVKAIPPNPSQFEPADTSCLM